MSSFIVLLFTIFFSDRPDFSIRRGKLFIFGETLLDKGTGNKTWKERGVGDFKLLKHKENGRIRALMRQEKTMKIIVNHFVDPRITLTPNVGNDKSWVWVAFDYADNELIETVSVLYFSLPCQSV